MLRSLTRLSVALAPLVLAACVSISVEEREVSPDAAALAAIQNAQIRQCPADRTQPNARSEGFGATSGAQAADVGFAPLAHDPTRALRLRRLSVEPGGVIAWHDHRTLQGMAIVLSGEMVELRNTCLDPITYRAGDISLEDAGTAHGWRNEGDETAVILVAHVVTR